MIQMNLIYAIRYFI